MKRINLIIIGLTFLIISCSEKVTEIYEDPFNATVLRQGMDCGKAFLIQFNDNVSGLPINTRDNIFYAINLPEEYKINGMKIKVEFREPFNNEIMVCTAMGPGYPQIYITKVE